MSFEDQGYMWRLYGGRRMADLLQYTFHELRPRRIFEGEGPQRLLMSFGIWVKNVLVCPKRPSTSEWRPLSTLPAAWPKMFCASESKSEDCRLRAPAQHRKQVPLFVSGRVQSGFVSSRFVGLFEHRHSRGIA